MDKSLMKDPSTQLDDLKDAVADLGQRVSEIASSRAQQAKKRANAAAKSVRNSGGQIYEDGVEALQSAGDSAVYYGRRAGTVVRNNPGLTLLGVAIGVGVLAAIIYASQEDDRRWYDKRRTGWF
ncbi:hypothetical protein [Hansschlegelia plantiphila]|nr:hypothetical protein [Hansschlegelia plantiphila]